MLQPIDEPAQRLSRAEFHAWADAQPRGKFERHSGVVIAMAPEPCEAFSDGMTVEIGMDDDFVPDAIVRCGFSFLGNVTKVSDPLIVVEVLSPSTSATDRAEKLEKYFRLPSVQHYLIIWADRRRVVHHERVGNGIGTTVHTKDAIALEPPGLSLDVAELYAEIGDLSERLP